MGYDIRLLELAVYLMSSVLVNTVPSPALPKHSSELFSQDNWQLVHFSKSRYGNLQTPKGERLGEEGRQKPEGRTRPCFSHVNKQQRTAGFFFYFHNWILPSCSPGNYSCLVSNRL